MPPLAPEEYRYSRTSAERHGGDNLFTMVVWVILVGLPLLAVLVVGAAAIEGLVWLVYQYAVHGGVQ